MAESAASNQSSVVSSAGVQLFAARKLVAKLRTVVRRIENSVCFFIVFLLDCHSSNEEYLIRKGKLFRAQARLNKAKDIPARCTGIIRRSYEGN